VSEYTEFNYAPLDTVYAVSQEVLTADRLTETET